MHHVCIAFTFLYLILRELRRLVLSGHGSQHHFISLPYNYVTIFFWRADQLGNLKGALSSLLNLNPQKLLW